MLILELGVDVLFEISKSCDFITIKNLTRANRDVHHIFTHNHKFINLVQIRLSQYIRACLNIFIRSTLSGTNIIQGIGHVYNEQHTFVRTRLVKFNKVDDHNFTISADILTKRCDKLYECKHDICADRESLELHKNRFITRYILKCFETCNAFSI